MPVHAEMMQGVVRVIGDDQPALEPALRRRAVVGSGFIVRIPSEQHAGARYNYVVTAAHVIAGQSNVEIQAAIPSPAGGLSPPWLLPTGTILCPRSISP